MKFYLMGLVVAMLSVATHANQFKISPPFGKVAIGRCYMDECTWMKIKNKKIIQQTKFMTKVKATLISGDSSVSGKDPVSWDNKPFNVVAECSKARPRIFSHGLEYEVNPRDFSGVEESSVNLYFLICHDYTNGVYDGAKRFKY